MNAGVAGRDDEQTGEQPDDAETERHGASSYHLTPSEARIVRGTSEPWHAQINMLAAQENTNMLARGTDR